MKLHRIVANTEVVVPDESDNPYAGSQEIAERSGFVIPDLPPLCQREVLTVHIVGSTFHDKWVFEAPTDTADISHDDLVKMMYILRMIKARMIGGKY